ncbi:MAG TPA: hypothetical protein VH298_11505 [Jatrophihabitans sp.]|jgi:hypothetical protein|nr:hypothetical protein [Jatrophihabitans sp.]
MTSPAADSESSAVDPAAELAAEFEASTRRLGIEVPPQLLRGVLLGHRSLTGLAALLREAEDGLVEADELVVPGA